MGRLDLIYRSLREKFKREDRCLSVIPVRLDSESYGFIEYPAYSVNTHGLSELVTGSVNTCRFSELVTDLVTEPQFGELVTGSVNL